MKKPFASWTFILPVTLIASGASSIGLAHAAEPNPKSDAQSYYVQIAQQIVANLQSAEAHFNSSDRDDFALLNATSDEKAVGEQDKSPNSSILEDHSQAENRLAARFAGEYKQADNIDDPNYISSIPFIGQRDIYTFCPEGSEVKRAIKKTASLDTNRLEYSWGWSHCSSGDAIRVQDIWVSNVKQGHPLLTLLMVEDGQPGQKTNLEIDLNQLAAGKLSADEILKSIRPMN